jgi:hypothetical protein
MFSDYGVHSTNVQLTADHSEAMAPDSVCYNYIIYNYFLIQ